MKIIILNTSLRDRGSDRVFLDHVKEFGRFATVRPVVLEPSENQPLLVANAPVAGLGAAVAAGGVLPTIARFLQQARHLRRLVDRENADVVVSHSEPSNIVNVLSMSRARKILVLHNSIVNEPSPGRRYALFRQMVGFPVLYNSASRVVAVSADLANEMRSFGIRNAVGIPNFFNNAQIFERSMEAIPDNIEPIFWHGRKILVTMGRLEDQKQHDKLIEVFCAARAANYPIRLLIMGSGSLRDALLARCRERDIKAVTVGLDSIDRHADVVFAEWQRNPFSILRQCDLFLFPSLWEGFPMALCEAMIVGLPVISSDCPTGPREILNADRQPASAEDEYFGQCGVLLPIIRSEREVRLWAKAVIRLLNDPDAARRMGEHARVRMHEFDADRIVGVWRELIGEALDGTSRANGTSLGNPGETARRAG